MMEAIWPWLAFNGFILAMLALDLGVFHRHSHAISMREAVGWSVAWVILAMVFGAGVWHFMGAESGMQFFTGYVIEKSLSVDNIFVILLIFTSFAVPAAYQHRVLFWGILGALVMRGLFIVVGSVLLQKFHWIIYVFGGFLIVTGIKMVLSSSHQADPSTSLVVRAARRLFPVTPGYEGDRFFIVRDGKRWATPLFVVLLLIESTDLIFAVDSIPAIFAISQDPFIVYTSNVFAILGLRSLYFCVSGLVERFVYLKAALSFILVFVGTKMLLMDVYKVPTLVSLGVILFTLIIAIIASAIKASKPRQVSRAA